VNVELELDYLFFWQEQQQGSPNFGLGTATATAQCTMHNATRTAQQRCLFFFFNFLFGGGWGAIPFARKMGRLGMGALVINSFDWWTLRETEIIKEENIIVSIDLRKSLIM